MKESGKTKRKSIKTQAFKAVSISMFVLLFITLAMGFRFYTYSCLKNYKDGLRNLGNYSLTQLDRKYLEKKFDETKKIYESIPEEIKNDPFTDEYKSYFLPTLDDEYFKAREVLVNCRESTDVSNIAYGFYDKDHERFVIVLDGDLDDYFYIAGQYISDENGTMESWSEIEKIINSDWYMSFNHTSLMGIAATEYMPITSENGSIIGLIALDTQIHEFQDELLTYLSIFIPLLMLAFGVLSYFISKTLEKKVLSPVRSLVDAARAYTDRDKVNETGNTSYFGSILIDTTNEIADLRDTMAEMERDIYNSMEEIRRVTGEKERIAAELDIAAEIQQSALLKTFPESDRFDLYAAMIPAREVAGDFYDVFLIDEDHLCMLIADVSGKGVPAALFMMKGKEILKNRAIKGGKPSEILEFANNELASDNETAMFITVWLGILEISTGVITAASAGHEYPFIKDPDGPFRRFDDPHGVLCGVVENAVYENYSVTIPRGGCIFLYTDGIPEAMDKEEKFFGMDRIEKSLNSHIGAAPKELIGLVDRDIKEFSAGMDQFDDITMLCLYMK